MTHSRFFVLSLALAFLLTACADSDSPRNDIHSSQEGRQPTPTQQLEEHYKNAQYDVSLSYPAQWILLEEANLTPAMGTFAINIFKGGTGAEQETPLQVHAKAQHSYVAIWPHGYGTELPASQYARLDTVENTPDFQFQVDMEASKALVLKDGTVWAYNIVPVNPPANWEEYGFIFAQIASENHRATCYDAQTGQEKPLRKCDFLGGDDRYVRQADIINEDAQTIRRMLESISLEQIEEKAQATELINVDKPAPNMDVTSPLKVTGEARGTWYFEGSFRVELVDYRGKVLAEQPAQAQGEWMTEDFVPFEATLEFDPPDDERGYLIFHRANPSGLPEHAMQYKQPVIFPPK